MNSRWLPAAFVLLFAIAVGGVTSTYTRLIHTVDESGHIACGLEILQKRTFTFDYHHPPLSRMFMGIGPWLLGTKNVERKEDVERISPEILYNSANYTRTLAYARVGMLPFLIAAGLAVLLFTREFFGLHAAFWAVFLLFTVPPVLGHAGLATTDSSLMASLPWSLLALHRWVGKYDTKRTIFLGIAISAGILSKYTFFLYFPVTATVLVIYCWWHSSLRPPARPVIYAVLTLTVFVTVWAGFWFSVDGYPLRQLHLGLKEILEHSNQGHRSFLLGEIRTNGWWYFFPTVFFFKTPLPFLFLSLLAFRQRNIVLVLCAAALMASVLPSRINLGLRHILPIYPLLAVGAGAALAAMLASRHKLVVAVGILLAAWQGVSSIAAHPNHIAYFNALAGDEPEYIRVDSDLDWGQSMEQIAEFVRERNIQEPIHLALFGAADPSRHGLEWRPASAWQPIRGWLAVSATEFMMSEERRPVMATGQPWQWLDAYRPVARIGNAVRVYYIP